MLTASEAATIARRAGLTLSDAVSLRLLADTTAEAESLAAKFGGEADTGAVTRELTRNLFGANDRQDDDPGATAEQNFARGLFKTPPNDAA